LEDITLFTSQPVARFYEQLFLNLNLSTIAEYPKIGHKGYSAALSILADTHSFLADKGYDTKAIYNQIAHLHNGECFIPLNKRGTKTVKTLPKGTSICESGLAMHQDGKFPDAGCTRQKFGCPFKRSRIGHCPCNHKNFLNGKKNRGCTKYQTIPDDLRLSIDRTSKTFTQNYS